MEREHDTVKKMWTDYLGFIEDIENTEKTYSSWYFGGDKNSANNLADLVMKGIKRGTTSLYYFYELENDPLPKKGDLSIITDYSGTAQCVIETIKVTVLPFKEVTEELAFIEGEGDKSLDYWRRAHISFFTKELEEEGKKFSEDMLVVFEEFKVVYK
ncbi:RNA-binding protein [Clostridium acetobutylicum]|nr:RNA-binding protein [Clostridium acetobutylicum]